MVTVEQEVHPGCRRLVEELDRAVASSTVPDRITHAVQDALSTLIHAGEIKLPEPLRQPSPTSYARRLVHADPRLGYSVLAMVWNVGQGTALHNHAGMWCVEGVVEGSIEVTQYSLLESDGERFRFQREGSGNAGVGEAGRLIPPFEYHTLKNSLATQPSITLHVYGGEMNRCSIFEPEGGDLRGSDWYREVMKTLVLTD